MSDCRKIEENLWTYGSLSRPVRDMVDRHLSVCGDCRAALETIKALGLSSQADKELLESINTEAFDVAVLNRIKGSRKILNHPVLMPQRYSLRMALSFALAAMVVLVLVKSVSDLQELGLPSMADRKKSVEVDQYGMINIELKPADGPIKTDEPIPAANEADRLAKKSVEPDSPAGVSIPSEEPALAAIPKEEKGQSIVEEAGRGAMELSGPPSLASLPETRQREATSGSALSDMKPSLPQPDKSDMVTLPVPQIQKGRSKEDIFTILTKPVTSPSPDSISIDAIYVSDESISPTQQSRAASLAEVYTDTGAVQTSMPQASVLVTIEKMPKPLKMEIPVYPVWAKKQGISGTVWIKARIDIAGRVSTAEVISCDRRGAGFEDAALDAARESQFIPASSNGINLPVWIVYPVKFIYKD